MKAAFIINPKSGKGKTASKLELLNPLITTCFDSHTIVETTSKGHASQLVNELINDDYLHVIVAGGDGTFNEAVNGYFKDDKPINPDAMLSFLPSGTGGDFARNFDSISKDLHKSLVNIMQGKVYEIDTGKCVMNDKKGEKKTFYFNNIASVGISDIVAEKVNNSTKLKKFGRYSFLIAGVKELIKQKPKTIHVVIDDEDFGELPLNLIAICNGTHFGGGMMVAPDAKLDDGLFDVVFMANFNLIKRLIASTRVYKGTHLKNDKIRHLRAQKIVLKTKEATRIEIDGEIPGSLDAEFTVLHKKLKVKY